MRGAGAMAGAASAEIETAVVASGRGSLAGRSAMSFTVRAGISFSGDLPWMRYPLTTVFQDAGMETQIDQSLMATVIHATEMTTEVLP